MISLKVNPNLGTPAPHSLPPLPWSPHSSPRQGPRHPWATKSNKEVTLVSGYVESEHGISNHAVSWLALPLGAQG